jgi:magnesium transporter
MPADEHLAVPAKKRKGHRGGMKKRTRQQSFAAHNNGTGSAEAGRSRSDLQTLLSGTPRTSFYSGRNLSETSLESEVLLDHRYGRRR